MSEMFVHRSGKDVYLAYGIPDEWKTAYCRHMVIEGGHRISMDFEEYQVRKVTVKAARTEKLDFHFAKVYGNVRADGINLGNVENCELCLEKGAFMKLRSGGNERR